MRLILHALRPAALVPVYALSAVLAAVGVLRARVKVVR